MGQFDTFLAQYGRNATWMERQADGSYTNKGTIKVIVEPAPKSQEQDPTYGESIFRRIYTSTVLKLGDQLVVDGQTWDVGPVDKYENVTLGETYYRTIIKGSQVPA